MAFIFEPKPPKPASRIDANIYICIYVYPMYIYIYMASMLEEAIPKSAHLRLMANIRYQYLHMFGDRRDQRRPTN